jgi:hypothetical protein
MCVTHKAKLFKHPKFKPALKDNAALSTDISTSSSTVLPALLAAALPTTLVALRSISILMKSSTIIWIHAPERTQ